jgi:TonB family protein
MSRRTWLPRWLPALLITVAAAQPGALGASAPSATAIAEIRSALQHDDPAAAVAAARPLAEAGDPEAQFVLGLLIDMGAGARLDHDVALGWLQQAAEHHALAAHYLRWKFETGSGITKPDPAALAHWRSVAGERPEIASPYDRWLGLRAGLVASKLSRATLWMMSRASEGDVIAEANLADVYISQGWIAPNPEQHLYWLRQAAAHGDVSSVERLASYYELGVFVDKDPAQVLALRRQAAEAGSASAQFGLGEQYRTGDGVAANPVEAAKWLRLAAAQDHLEALLRLGDLLRAGAPELPVDFAAAMQVSRRAAALGSAEALADVAGMLREGQGAPKDPAAAARLYEEAAAKGYPHAAAMLGWMYSQGELGSRDHALGRTWYEKAAEQGNAYSMQQLGLIYRDGLGVPKNPSKAFEWFERAAREGDGWAQNEVGWMLRRGIGEPRDDEEAVNWFRLAAKNGEPRGEANLGFHYLHGLGVPADPVEATRHLILAGRELDDAWAGRLFAEAFVRAAANEQATLRDLLQSCLQDPDLLQLKGGLPEWCLSVLESAPGRRGDTEAASKLLAAMKSARRPQSRVLLASHAFIALNTPYDPELARSLAEQAASEGLDGGQRLLATIDSVAAPKPAQRSAARATLRQMAEAGDLPSAQTVASRLMTGFAEDFNPDLARQLLRRALVKAGVETAAQERAIKALDQLEPAPVNDEEVSAKIAGITGQRSGGDAPLQPIVFPPPIYPTELRISGLQGEAEIVFTVDENGRTEDVHAQSSTHPLFAAAGEAAVKRWRFAPTWEKGKPVAREVSQRLHFTLAGDEKSARATP